MKRVLIVDDDHEVRALVRRVLEDAGFACDEAADAASALRRLGRRHDLVLVDLGLAGGEADLLLTRIAEAAEPPPVVGMGARGEYEPFVRGVRAGIDGFVARPFHMGEFLETCRGAIGAAARRREGAAEPGAERRRSERRPLMIAAHLLTAGGSPLAMGEIVDVAPTGARLILMSPFAVGDEIRISLEPAVAGSLLDLAAVVRWQQRTATGYSHGVEFRQLSDAARRELERLIGSRGDA